jgi:hypothetical protein
MQFYVIYFLCSTAAAQRQQQQQTPRYSEKKVNSERELCAREGERERERGFSQTTMHAVCHYCAREIFLLSLTKKKLKHFF